MNVGWILALIAGGGIIGYFVLGRGSGKLDFMSKIKDIFQKKKQEEIKRIEEKQNRVMMDIEVKEKVSKQAKERIDKTIKDASEEIEKIQKEENIGKIHKEIISDWSDI